MFFFIDIVCFVFFSFLFVFVKYFVYTWITLKILYIRGVAISICHGLCGSNKLLWRRCALIMERLNFRPPPPPQLLHFFNRTFWKWKPMKISEKHAKFGWRLAREWGLRKYRILAYLRVLFCRPILVTTSRSHRWTDNDQWQLKTRLSAKGRAFGVLMIKK